MVHLKTTLGQKKRARPRLAPGQEPDTIGLQVVAFQIVGPLAGTAGVLIGGAPLDLDGSKTPWGERPNSPNSGEVDNGM
jgi:hypothetical protein